MEVLQDYPQEFAKMFWTSFNFLSKVNLKFWFRGESWVTRYWRFLYIVPAIAIFSIILTIDVCKLMMEGDVFKIAYRLPPFLIMNQGVLKVLLLFPKTSQITNIIKELGALWRTTGLNDKQLKDRRKILKKFNFCNTATYWISIIGTSQYLLSPLFETLFYKFILQQDLEPMLPIIASSYPFNPTGNLVVYLAVYAFQIYGMLLCVLAYVGTELIMISICALLGTEFTLLCEDMLLVKPESKKEFGNIKDTIRTDYSIEDFVKKHQKLVSLSSQMDDVFNKIILVDLLFVGGTTCFFRYAAQFSRGPTHMLSSYIGVAASLSYVLYLCYYGKLLTGASLHIGQAAYESFWYKGDKYHQKINFMIIKRSQKACCLTSMKYAPITLNMFTKVMSTTWSYMSLMNSVYGEE